ncbi:MAG TPA: metal-dependent transcriptional regulator [Clostridiales bacterium]|nr:metal-dependent transcriptional regulator [Clostridiales bacterium]
MTKSKQDYLKVIYELGGNNKPVSNKDVSNILGISAPSVTEMIKKLLIDGYIESTPYKGISLTPKGLVEAMKVLRRHLLWEVFLVDHLGLNWEDVHDEAEKLEHVTSSKLEKSLDEYLNHPRFCPHGTVISYEDEEVKQNYKALNKVAIGMKVIIKRVKDKRDLLRFISTTNLNIGDEIEIVNIDNENIIIKKNKENIILIKEKAAMIFVE